MCLLALPEGSRSQIQMQWLMQLSDSDPKFEWNAVKQVGIWSRSCGFVNSEVGVLPYRVQIKRLIEKVWNFDKKCS